MVGFSRPRNLEAHLFFTLPANCNCYVIKRQMFLVFSWTAVRIRSLNVSSVQSVHCLTNSRNNRYHTATTCLVIIAACFRHGPQLTGRLLNGTRWIVGTGKEKQKHAWITSRIAAELMFPTASNPNAFFTSAAIAQSQCELPVELLATTTPLKSIRLSFKICLLGF